MLMTHSHLNANKSTDTIKEGPVVSVAGSTVSAADGFAIFYHRG